MGGKDRTEEFQTYIQRKPQGSPSTVSRRSRNGLIEESQIVLTSRQMLSSIRKMATAIVDHRSDYLDLNRFLKTKVPTTSNKNKSRSKTSKDPQHVVWTDDDRLKFENQALIFVKDITSQINDLSNLLDRSPLKLDHQYIDHQKSILQCLRIKVTSLSDDIKQLIRSRSQSLQRRPYQIEREERKKKEEREMEQFVDELMAKGTIDEMLNKKGKNPQDGDSASSVLKDIKENIVSSFAQKLKSKDKDEQKDGNGMTGLSNLEMQEFMKENEDMVKVLQEEEQEVMMAEQKTVEIVELLSMFTEQVVNQQSTIGGIEGAILQSWDNLKVGNRELEKARERGKDTRTVFMTVVLTLAFSLLFLDWYKS